MLPLKRNIFVLLIVLFPFSFLSFYFCFFFLFFFLLFFSDDRGIASDRKLTKPGQSGSDEGNFCIAMLILLFTTTTTTTTKTLLLVIWFQKRDILFLWFWHKANYIRDACQQLSSIFHLITDSYLFKVIKKEYQKYGLLVAF